MERPTLFIASGAGDATVEDPGEHRAWLRYLRKRARHELRDDVGCTLDLSRCDSGFRPFDSRENFAFRGSNQHAGLRSASVNTNYDFTQFQRSPSVGAGCVNDERIATPIVNDVPINTYQGNAICEIGVSASVSDGNISIICFANTTKLIAIIPTAMPSIASLWMARRHNMPRKKPPSNAP